MGFQCTIEGHIRYREARDSPSIIARGNHHNIVSQHKMIIVGHHLPFALLAIMRSLAHAAEDGQMRPGSAGENFGQKKRKCDLE